MIMSPLNGRWAYIVFDLDPNGISVFVRFNKIYLGVT